MPSNTPLPAAEFRRLEGNLIEYAVAVLDDPGNMLAHATLEIALDELKDALAASPRTLEEDVLARWYGVEGGLIRDRAEMNRFDEDILTVSHGLYEAAHSRALDEAQKGGAK